MPVDVNQPDVCIFMQGLGAHIYFCHNVFAYHTANTAYFFCSSLSRKLKLCNCTNIAMELIDDFGFLLILELCLTAHILDALNQ